MKDDASIARVPWLSGLTPDEQTLLIHASRRRLYESGAVIFEPTETPASIYLLDTGRVRIYRASAEGEEATLGYVAPGEVFGELPGFGSFPRESSAKAQKRSMVWRLRVEVFRKLVRTYPQIGIEVTRQIAERLKRVESRVEGLILRDVRSRLAAALLELAEHFGHSDGPAWTIEFPLSQTEIGTLVGASRQSVNAAMMAFREAGWLTQTGGTLILLRPDLLRSQVTSNESD